MQQYSSYKPSGIEWLGDIPVHWKVDKLKNYCEIFASNVDKKYDSDEIEVSLCNYVDVYKNQAITKNIEFMIAGATVSEIVKFQLQLNDILLTKDSESPDDIAVPSIVKEVFDKFLCGYHLSIIRCLKKLEPDFLIWVLRDLSIATQFHREAVGITRFGLASRHFKNGVIAFAERFEQLAIADYLNKASSNIDTVIATKQHQLEKLELYKKATIHQAVTKGLDKTAILKPSGIEWIGDVPVKWKIERLKDICINITSGGTPKTNIDDFWDNGTIIWLSPTDFQDFEGSDYIDNSRNKITLEGLNNCSASILPIGTVIMQSRASIGAAKISSKELSTNQGFINFIPGKLLNNKYLFYLIKVFLGDYFQNIASGTTFMEISRSKAKQEKIPLPTFTAQTEIVSYLDNFCNNISSEKTIINQQIAALQQYRKSLIHDCVTGKRKVI
ncbi:MAG: restriction endonuclease subunit S [Bacteroidota bacterium]